MLVVGGLNGFSRSSPTFSGLVTADSFLTSRTGSTSVVFGANTTLGIGFDTGAGDVQFLSSSVTQWRVAGSNGNFISDQSRSISTGGSGIFGIVGSSAGLKLDGSGGTSVKSAGYVSVSVGTGAQAAFVGGTTDAVSTAVGNLGASGPDDLQVTSIAANSLVNAIRGIRIKAWGTTANNANAKTVRLMFGSTAVITKQLTVSIAGFWKIECLVLRTGTSTQKFWAEAVNYGGTTVSSTDGATVLMLANATTCAESEVATITIKGQSTVSTTDNDIVQQGLTVEYV